MHELSLATALIEQLEDAARREGATCIERVTVSIGALSGVEREPFDFCFPLAAEATMAEGAELRIEEVPATLRCDACGAETQPAFPELACAACGSAAVHVVAGRDFVVRSMEVT